MKNTVKLVEFKLADHQKADVEKALADWLDEGFVITAQHESDGYLTFTLVRTQYGIKQLITGEQEPAKKFQIVDGAVQTMLH